MIEIQTFRLAPDADEAAFRAADARAQTEIAYQQPGLARRTTARSDDGEWAVVTLWATAAQADAATPVIDALVAFIDAGSLRVARYEPLD